MTRRIRIECDYKDCPRFVQFSNNNFSLCQIGWEYRAEGTHVCPDHVDKSSDDILREKMDE